jgi:hypothetical protein
MAVTRWSPSPRPEREEGPTVGARLCVVQLYLAALLFPGVGPLLVCTIASSWVEGLWARLIRILELQLLAFAGILGLQLAVVALVRGGFPWTGDADAEHLRAVLFAGDLVICLVLHVAPMAIGALLALVAPGRARSPTQPTPTLTPGAARGRVSGR